MTPAELLFPTYRNMLGSLEGWLAKAAEYPRGDTLLEARLAEDMFPLASQIRFCCNLPGEAMKAISGLAFDSSDSDDATLRKRVSGSPALASSSGAGATCRWQRTMPRSSCRSPIA